MGPSNPPTARKTTGPRSKAARSRTAGNLPTLISNTDPFHVLDDLSIREIFLLLSPIDIVRCDAVSRFWRATVEFHLTNSVIRRDFPYAWETGRITDTGRSGEKVGEFKRIAYEDWVLRHGQAVWARHFPCVNMSTVAGDYVVWHERGQGYLQWQILSGKGKNGREVGETKMLHLFELIEPARSITVDSLHVNENGLLHAKLWVLDSTYCSETAIGTYLARNVVFSLRTNRTIWGNVYNHCTNCMDPIQIGSSFIYYVKSENRGNGLHTHDSTFIACEMRREKLVYTHHYPDVLLGAKDFRLFSLKGHEYLILVDSWRLRRRSKDGVGEIAIIDGATGNITQTLKWGGSSLNVIAKPNSFTFALCYSPGGNTKFGFTRIYSQKQDGTFSCDSAVAVQNPWASDYAFNPFTLRGYTIFPGRDVYTISLRKRFMPDVPRRLEVGSEGFCLIMQSSVTLPPKESGVKRRLCKNNAFANVDCGRMAMIGVTGTRVAFFAENTMFIFDFGAPW